MKLVKVMLIEDNPADIELVQEALKLAGLEAVLDLSTNFEQAKNQIEKIGLGVDFPEIVLLDLNLPRGSGFELLKLLRARPEARSLPVIVVSSSKTDQDRARASQLGASDYFRKPTDLDEFMRLGQIVRESISASGSWGTARFT